MFGLVTMAAAHYLSGSSPLMRPSAEVEVVEVEEERAQGGGRGASEGRGAALCTYLTHRLSKVLIRVQVLRRKLHKVTGNTDKSRKAQSILEKKYFG